MPITVYHNQACSHSCAALKLLEEKGLDVQVIDYLTNPPSKETILALLLRLKIQPKQLIRIKEPVFQPYLYQSLTDEQYIELMVQFPILIQRPIVVHNDKAILGRPPELVLTIL